MAAARVRAQNIARQPERSVASELRRQRAREERVRVASTPADLAAAGRALAHTRVRLGHSAAAARSLGAAAAAAATLRTCGAEEPSAAERVYAPASRRPAPSGATAAGAAPRARLRAAHDSTWRGAAEGAAAASTWAGVRLGRASPRGEVPAAIAHAPRPRSAPVRGRPPLASEMAEGTPGTALRLGAAAHVRRAELFALEPSAAAALSARGTDGAAEEPGRSRALGASARARPAPRPSRAAASAPTARAARARGAVHRPRSAAPRPSAGGHAAETLAPAVLGAAPRAPAVGALSALEVDARPRVHAWAAVADERVYQVCVDSG